MLGDFFVLGCTTGQLVFGTKLNNLRHDVIRECHDIKWADGYRLDISLDRNGLLVATICYQVETNVRTCLIIDGNFLFLTLFLNSHGTWLPCFLDQ